MTITSACPRAHLLRRSAGSAVLLAALCLAPAAACAEGVALFAGFEILNGHAAPDRYDRTALFKLGAEQRLLSPFSVGARIGVGDASSGATLDAAVFTRVDMLRRGGYSVFVEGSAGALSRTLHECNLRPNGPADDLGLRECGQHYRTGFATSYGVGVRFPSLYKSTLVLNLLRLTSDDGADYVMAGVSWM